MTHEQAHPLLGAYADGELDLVKSLEVEEHLRGCDACGLALANLRTLRSAVRETAPYYQVPSKLEDRIGAALTDMRRAEGRGRFVPAGYSWIGAAIAAVLLITIAAGGIRSLVPRTNDLTIRELVDDHLRSLTANHLTDVLSSNQHTVKPWFDGRLNFTPPVGDLSAQGFPLIGGRLDYLNDQLVAAVVYRRRQHIINLFVAPSEHAADRDPQSEMREGYNIVHWTKSGMSYWAVSSASTGELQKFAELVRTESARPSTPE